MVLRSWGLGVLGTLAFGLAATVAQTPKTVKDGVYTEAQAERGRALYKTRCASCHAPNRFTDDRLFLTPYAGKPLWEIFDVIRETMPEDDPGGMPPEEYADVTAFLLQLNGFATGSSELPPSRDVLTAIVFVKP